MILKFILMGSFCFMINGETKCSQYIKEPYKDGPECEEKATLIGKALKAQIAKNEGVLTEYSAHCMAISENGYDVDYSFQISYNIS